MCWWIWIALRRWWRCSAIRPAPARRSMEMATRASASWPHLHCTLDEASMSERPLRIGVVGLGYWGPNLARNFAAIPGCELAWCCDTSPEARSRIGTAIPTVRVASDIDELLRDPGLDAIAIATPVPSHAELAVRVLEAGKHCLVEKPLAQALADAQRVVTAAEASGRTLMVGHLLEYHPGVQQLRSLADSGEPGASVYYIYGNGLYL